MTLDFRNVNMLWASVLVETLAQCGLRTVIICPGSRSAPLAIAFAQHPTLEAIPILDERSASFFALGLARRTGLPVALVCTSGTAGANFYPAVIEAHESRVPLLLLTADCPPESLHCHAGQAVDQVHLYSHYPNWQVDLALPVAEPQMLAYLRQTVIQGWERSLHGTPGPVHFNLPFREPLAPTLDPQVADLAQWFDEPLFFQGVQPQPAEHPGERACLDSALLEEWRGCDRGLIIAGPAIPACALTYCRAVGVLSQHLGWPVLAEGLSPLRNYLSLNPFLISTYDIVLRNPDLAAQLKPSFILRLGELPTSKMLRLWIQALSVPQWIVEPSDHNVDPLHSSAIHLRTTIEAIAQGLFQFSVLPDSPVSKPYTHYWLNLELSLRQVIAHTFQQQEIQSKSASSEMALNESKIAWVLSQSLPPQTPLFISNSMPVRDIELFWQPGQLEVQPYFNRGANGIEGILSCALGVTHHRQGVLLTGDLALLHDTNGFLIQPHWQGHLTIVLVNNNGGGIFEMLPVASFDPPFETFFVTSQRADFAQICAAYQVEHVIIQSWKDLVARLNPLPITGIRVLEVRCNRKADAQWRKDTLARLSSNFSATVTQLNIR
ncbi:2-succinyl-5-enolpyruvyl-6-hydroxy-3-cyclohexene-1-carboxylic-acid synthase [Nostoc parmelioides]|uniref:2-succinyl-5-enolpyruvyl-6-hydroxy-3-cyclohexene-1-carboxylate synthase n=1 Tax=Nostoc parmelioides FACHB-3921 TaxID=2692909 RepID=A0ABR8BS96_9NOSO|nr:2-succinyl-5-enolpyruvyl-6-hydroxy-3-cyclohexene-1-carboxylic-acid synthase [Nostoc parmelioides]MBD2255775.1 2-succinyl-5-enolpyruvyl-6-hydroxy-3-cyclohexene-1-carboxylic-acid synthase [Nostoc parmelioides FACHB-3921]